jgi:hypothetical protein
VGRSHIANAFCGDAGGKTHGRLFLVKTLPKHPIGASFKRNDPVAKIEPQLETRTRRIGRAFVW